MILQHWLQSWATFSKAALKAWVDPPPFCLLSPPESSLSLLQPRSWGCSRSNTARNALMLIPYEYTTPRMPVAARRLSSVAPCPSRSPSGISPANHPVWMWLCHWELKVPPECIWKACGYVLPDIVTNPSCTAGCRIEGRGFPGLWCCKATEEGYSNVILLCSIFFPRLKKPQTYEKVPLPHA